ncbi:PIN domain-containing protein [Dyella terrae]|uniref:PIN domain-containing protein n=1 Tax=Dyella terrae TaxID=522259 RepID=UPI001EFE7C6A|nr:PIN domain-containing protein [Dyella terrae]ULU23785.1 PIN domain protein [Dyella terrae]
MAKTDQGKLRELILSELTVAVCIDTNIYEQQQFAFHRGLLAEVPALTRSGIRLVMPDVVAFEVVNHLRDKLPEGLNDLRKAARLACNYGLTTEAIEQQIPSGDVDYRQLASDRLTSYVHRTNALEIQVAKFASLSTVIDRYFNLEAPFESKKKAEFPDAFALSALESWAEAEGSFVVVVSDDAGWNRFAESSKRLLTGVSLKELLVATQDPDVVLLRAVAALIRGDGYESIKQRLEDNISGMDIRADAHSYHYAEAEVVEVIVKSIDVSDLKAEDLSIIRNEEGRLIVSWEVQVDISVEASVSLSVYDSVDKDYVVLGSESVLRDLTQWFDTLMTLEVSVESGEPSLKFDDIELTASHIDVDLGEVELDYSDDSDV